MSNNPALGRLLHLADSQVRPELRIHRRYPIALAVQYKWNQSRSAQRLGSGITINISSGGVLFRASETLPVRSPIELALNWPVSIDDCALKLVLRGRVVRSLQDTTAVRVIQYEFRTAGTPRSNRLHSKK